MDASVERVEACEGVLGYIPLFWFPVRCKVHLRDEFFFGFDGSSRKIDFCEEILPESSVGIGGATVEEGRCRAELQSEADYGTEALW